jgi:hypothetical protein
MGRHGSRFSRRGFLRAGLAALALALSFPAAGLRPARADIPDVYYNSGTGHYYKYVSSTGTWAAAKAGAEALGGYLASVTDSAENQWILNNSGMGANSVWLGGSDAVSEGSWTWVSGETWSYSAWNGINGEPNGSTGENCLMMYGSAQWPGTWNDAYSTYTLPGYIVEWDVNPNVPPLPAAPTELTATLLGNGHVLLEWIDNATNEASFDVERKPAGSNFSNLASPAADSTSWEDVGAVGPAQFTYRVRASNAGGKSDWTNEASIDVPEQPSAPTAPSNLHSIAAGTNSVAIAWTDNSDDENGFELQRKNAAGNFQHVTTTAADAIQHLQSGLLPDTTYTYRVRAVNGNGSSAFAEGTAATTPTLAVAMVRADVKDTGKFAKDSVKVQAVFDLLESSDGTFDPVAEGITVRAGTASSPVTLIVPPNDVWKVKGARATWKSPKGSTPKYKLDVDLDDRLVKLTVSAVDLAVPAANPMRVSIVLGDDAGTHQSDWTPKKPGLFQYR